MTDIKRKLAVRRIIGLCLTVAFVVLASNATMTAKKHAGRFVQWQADRPADVAVDFSNTGTTTVPFNQTCLSAHSETIFLQVEGADLKSADALNGLAGSLTILYGNTVAKTFNLADAGTYNDGTSNNKFVLASFFPFDTGPYTLNIQIDQPAPALANRPQRLTAQYLLCGMEKLPELIEQGFAVCCWILVLSIGIPSVIGFFRFGWCAKP